MMLIRKKLIIKSKKYIYKLIELSISFFYCMVKLIGTEKCVERRKKMKDEKQLMLFFKKGTKLDTIALASKLKEKFTLLGEPHIIPLNKNNLSQPLIVFNKGDINLTVTFYDVSFVYNREDDDKCYDNMINILGCFEELDYSFTRMGYISTRFHSKKDKERFKDKVFKDPDMFSSEFQLSWYKKELIDSVSVNVWEREMTDLVNGVELVSVYDINTPIDEEYYISSEFVRDFIKKCDKYISNRDKK